MGRRRWMLALLFAVIPVLCVVVLGVDDVENGPYIVLEITKQGKQTSVRIANPELRISQTDRVWEESGQVMAGSVQENKTAEEAARQLSKSIGEALSEKGDATQEQRKSLIFLGPSPQPRNETGQIEIAQVGTTTQFEENWVRMKWVNGEEGNDKPTGHGACMANLKEKAQLLGFLLTLLGLKNAIQVDWRVDSSSLEVAGWPRWAMMGQVRLDQYVLGGIRISKVPAYRYLNEGISELPIPLVKAILWVNGKSGLVSARHLKQELVRVYSELLTRHRATLCNQNLVQVSTHRRLFNMQVYVKRKEWWTGKHFRTTQCPVETLVSRAVTQ